MWPEWQTGCKEQPSLTTRTSRLSWPLESTGSPHEVRCVTRQQKFGPIKHPESLKVIVKS